MIKYKYNSLDIVIMIKYKYNSPDIVIMIKYKYNSPDIAIMITMEYPTLFKAFNWNLSVLQFLHDKGDKVGKDGEQVDHVQRRLRSPLFQFHKIWGLRSSYQMKWNCCPRRRTMTVLLIMIMIITMIIKNCNLEKAPLARGTREPDNILWGQVMWAIFQLSSCFHSPHPRAESIRGNGLGGWQGISSLQRWSKTVELRCSAVEVVKVGLENVGSELLGPSRPWLG